MYLQLCVCDSNLGVYGDVIRVKILYNKRDSALIQFKETQQTQTGGHVMDLLARCSTWHHECIMTLEKSLCALGGM